MREPDPDVLLFFDGRPEALELYLGLEDLLYGNFPEVRRKVCRTQVSFSNRHVFACASFARVKRKSELPGEYLTVTLGLPRPLLSDRAAQVSEPYPGRWTCHVVVTRPDELDGELLDWLREAYDFALSK